MLSLAGLFAVTRVDMEAEERTLPPATQRWPAWLGPWFAALAGADGDNRASETPSEPATASSAPTAAPARLRGGGTSRVLAAPLK